MIELFLVAHLKPIVEAKARERQACGQGGVLLSPISGKANMPVDTEREMAKLAEVGHDTWAKYEVIQAKADDATKEALRDGDISY